MKKDVIVGTAIRDRGPGIGMAVQLDNGNSLAGGAILNGRLNGRRVRITIEVLPKDKSRG